MKIIKFLQEDPPYNPGEIAGFSDDVATRLIERGLAELHAEGEPDNPLTVGEMASRLAKRTGKPADYHARQIRHWSQSGLFDNAFWLRGTGVTSAREFSEVQLGRARLLVALAELGLTVNHMERASRCMSNLAFADREQFPGVTDALSFVVSELRRGVSSWFYEVHFIGGGVVIGGSFTTHPGQRPGPLEVCPVSIVLDATALLSPMFKGE